MSLLGDLEKRLEKMVEGIFQRKAVRVEPMDLARFLRKEMRDGKRAGLNRTYVPNVFVVALSSEDYNHLSSLGDAVMDELQNYLTLEAQQQGLEFISRIVILLNENKSLSQGEVDITASVRSGDGREVVGAQQVEDAPPPVPPTPSIPPIAAAPPVPGFPPIGVPPVPDDYPGTQVIQAAPPHHSHLSAEDSGWYLERKGGTETYVLPKWGAMIGRSRYAEICLDSLEVSRQHAQITFEEDGIALEDLDSTNGTRVNGARVRNTTMKERDELSIGSVTFVLRKKRT